jgi:hypothetical protein
MNTLLENIISDQLHLVNLAGLMTNVVVGLSLFAWTTFVNTKACSLFTPWMLIDLNN